MFSGKECTPNDEFVKRNTCSKLLTRGASDGNPRSPSIAWVSADASALSLANTRAGAVCASAGALSISERSRDDALLQEVQLELRQGQLSERNHAFLHGEPTDVVGSWENEAQIGRAHV